VRRQGKSGSAPFFRDLPLLIVIAALLLGILVRLALRDYESGDYTTFLSDWYDIITRNGGFYALDERFTNYSPPYLYLLTIATWLPFEKLYSIKLVSCSFDFLLAWFAFLTARELSTGRLIPAITFAFVFLAPTVMINSAMWAQCDCIYTSFILGTIYFLLRGRNLAAIIMWSLAFTFKQQAIFLLPVILILMLRGTFSWKYLLVIPVVYVIMMLPALIVGHPPMQLLTVYIIQAGTYAGLSHNAPSFYGAVGNINYNSLSGISIIAAAILVIVAGWFSLRAFFAEAGHLDGRLRFALLLILLPLVLTFLRPFGDLFLLLKKSPSTYAAISASVPGANEWLLGAPEMIGGWAIVAALIVAGLFCYAGSKLRIPAVRDPGSLITLSLLSTLLIPFMLTRMHGRYFYPADVISILFAIRYPRYFYIPLVIISTSLLSYYAYFRGAELVPIPVLSIAIALVLIVVMTKFAGLLAEKEEGR
jgi:Gpi18-like mannosyltransferase